MVRSWIFLAFFALAFLARAMVPVGFMPDFSGKHLIQICSGTEIKVLMIDGDGLPSSPSTQKEPCSFSFLSASLDGPHEFSQTFEAPTLVRTEDFLSPKVFEPHRLHLSPPSRAPPLLIA